MYSDMMESRRTSGTVPELGCFCGKDFLFSHMIHFLLSPKFKKLAAVVRIDGFLAVFP